MIASLIGQAVGMTASIVSQVRDRRTKKEELIKLTEKVKKLNMSIQGITTNARSDGERLDLISELHQRVSSAHAAWKDYLEQLNRVKNVSDHATIGVAQSQFSRADKLMRNVVAFSDTVEQLTSSDETLFSANNREIFRAFVNIYRGCSDNITNSFLSLSDDSLQRLRAVSQQVFTGTLPSPTDGISDLLFAVESQALATVNNFAKRIETKKNETLAVNP